MSCAIKSTVRQAPSVPFEQIAVRILGAQYSLSLVICGDRLAQRMNSTYRKKTYRPNVLSFPLSKREGEIFLNVRAAHREARRDHVPLKERCTYLFIHACLHLAGHDHGSAMDAQEIFWMKRNGFPHFSLGS